MIPNSINNLPKCSKTILGLLIVGSLFLVHTVSSHAGGAYAYRFPAKGVSFDRNAQTVIGMADKHVIQDKETLLDIARDYDLGFNEIIDLYPHMDPWVPPAGTELTIPCLWVPPKTREQWMVINIAELRLYYFLRPLPMVMTFPIGIGDQGWHTPLGTFPIENKRVHPTWFIPPSIQEKYGAKTMPSGPDNPLGDYYMKLGDTPYGIHGTNMPWSVGRLVSHGCIRLYPEDIERLYKFVRVGTPVEIIYEPVKFGLSFGNVYVEVHPDIYSRIADFDAYAWQRLAETGWDHRVDPEKFQQALNRKDGMPVNVTLQGE